MWPCVNNPGLSCFFPRAFLPLLTFPCCASVVRVGLSCRGLEEGCGMKIGRLSSSSQRMKKGERGKKEKCAPMSPLTFTVLILPLFFPSLYLSILPLILNSLFTYPLSLLFSFPFPSFSPFFVPPLLLLSSPFSITPIL